jgi:hypothetical protein
MFRKGDGGKRIWLLLGYSITGQELRFTFSGVCTQKSGVIALDETALRAILLDTLCNVFKVMGIPA